MGFVYNNPTEAMARTYLEMNGWLVQNSLFTDLLRAKRGRKKYRLEADLVDYKPPGTTILNQHGAAAPLDTSVGKPDDTREFFAGDNSENNWAYCELKANFLDVKYAQQVAALAGAGKENIEHKRKMIASRFGVLPPKVVIMAYNFTDDVLASIRANGWHYKDLGVMFDLIPGQVPRDVEHEGPRRLQRPVARHGQAPGVLRLPSQEEVGRGRQQARWTRRISLVCRVRSRSHT